MEYCILSGQDPVVYEGTNIIMLFAGKLNAKKHIGYERNENVMIL